MPGFCFIPLHVLGFPMASELNRTVLDSLVSAVTKVGTALDKRKSYGFCRPSILTVQECEWMYHGFDIARTICEIIPQEALSEPWQIKAGGDGADSSDALVETLTTRMRELGALEKVLDADVFSRCHGDCFLYVSVEDGRASEADPLDVEAITAVKFLRKIERVNLSPLTYYEDLEHPMYGEPEVYQVNPVRGSGASATAGMVKVHESRLLKFWGARTSDLARRENNMWHHSVLQAMYECIRDFASSWANAGTLLGNSVQGKYKLNGLARLLAAPGVEGREKLSKRIELIDYVRGLFNSLILDAETEDFTYEVAPLTSLPELMDRFAARLSAACGIPVTKLFGTSAAGMNATGEGDRISWFQVLCSHRRDHIEPAVEILLKMLLSAAGKQLDAAVVCWEPLDRPTPLEAAQIRSTLAATDVALITAEVIAPETVGEQRLTEGGWMHELVYEAPPEPEPEETGTDPEDEALNDASAE